MMHKYKRIFLVVMDSVGIGEAPDAEKFGDVGADTLGHIAEHMNGLNMPNMVKLGLGNIREMKGISKVENPLGYYTKNARKIHRERYNDRSLGNYGPLH